MDDDTMLYNLMKDLPDFDCFPIPQHWFKKFNIPPRNPISVREFIESGYAMKMAVAPKDLPPIIIDKPQQNGKLVQMVEEPPVPVEVISRPFELKEGEMFPAVLPSLKDSEPLERSHHLVESEPDGAVPCNACVSPAGDETSEQKVQE